VTPLPKALTTGAAVPLVAAGDAVHPIGVVQRFTRQVGHLRIAEEGGPPVQPLEAADPGFDERLLVDRRAVLLEQHRCRAAPAAGPVEQGRLRVVEDRARPSSRNRHDRDCSRAGTGHSGHPRPPHGAGHEEPDRQERRRDGKHDGADRRP